MKNKKSIWKFIIIFILSFLLVEGIELALDSFFHFNPHNLKWGWLGFIVIYGFKYHIFCCLLPGIWATYQCRHKCKHEHCKNK